MTSESGPGDGAPMEPDPTPMAGEASPVEEAKAAMRESKFSTPQGMVALGGWVLIGVWLVFEILLNDYGINTADVLLAVIAVLLFTRGTALASQIAPVAVLTKATGYLLAVLGVVNLVTDLRFADGIYNQFPDVLGALLAYAGYVLAFLGARSIKT